MYEIKIYLYHKHELDIYDYGRWVWLSELQEILELKRKDLPSVKYFRRKLTQLGLPKHTQLEVRRKPNVIHFHSKKFGWEKEYATVYFEEFNPKGSNE